MKFFLLALILIFNFQSLTKADDVRDFEIEGMSVGDSLHDHFSKKKISENYTIVSSTLAATNKRPEVKIDWRVYTKNKNQPLIRDLIIEGLSLARTQKEEFNSIILSADGDINALILKLKEFSNS